LCWLSAQQTTIIIVSKAPVEEQIGGWNVGKKGYTEVEYLTVKKKYFIMSYNSGFCLVDVQASAVYFANAPSQLFLEGKLGKPKEETGNLDGFEYMYLSDLKVPSPYFLYSFFVSIKVISIGTTFRRGAKLPCKACMDLLSHLVSGTLL
jgi:hypothetical protein